MMLEIKNIQKNFGGLVAVNNASMNVTKGSITGLIGPNGAGKTTLFNIIAGNLHSDLGEVYLEKEKISDLKAHELFEKGVLRTFQIAHEFSTLTVLENLMMVPGNQFGENLLYSWFKNSIVSKQEEEIRAKAIAVIDFLNLNHLTQELAGNLSGGQKKLLELGRTMMVDAKLVLLDEVGAGVNRTLLNEISDAIIRLNKEKDYTFFVIEHDMDLIEKICEPVIVMAEGSVLFQGSFEEVKSNEEVIEAYLGRGIKQNKALKS
ncbi:MAG: Lipopolysaccharide export system ATP-binding protein LptB [Alphaproteobacteria bacterium MarineAlpha5_Bin2]|nr:MAG: Lipopolysaccharide export system ATP-binding protein LptB [Alphaproteobacteria bacterium MarineAlpha5_Bin2]PPR55971.1 MAG: Lipopolysaccharide export system ATP-binding protein LptB [Alphaproteobacteria bacterium MarineAlpha5_Bin3]